MILRPAPSALTRFSFMVFMRVFAVCLFVIFAVLSGAGTALALAFFVIRPIDRVPLNTIEELPTHGPIVDPDQLAAEGIDSEEIQSIGRNFIPTSHFSG